VVDVVWAATSPTSGRFDPVETSSDVEILNDRFAALRARGEGYVELRRSEDFPVLTVGFRGSVAVVQVLTSPEAISLLEGDGSIQAGQVEVPVMDETAEFAGQAAVNVDHAWTLVQGFLGGRDLSELGHWIDD
jgi:hypothetical protein